MYQTLRVAIVFILTALFFNATFAITAHAADKNLQNPYQKTEISAGNVFHAINNKKAQIEANPEILKEIVKKELLPYVHVKYAAALSLGDNYKNISKEERSAYFSAFEQYLVQSFAQALSFYNGQTYQIEPEKAIDDKTNIVAVRVLLLVQDPSVQPIRLDLQWRKNTATGEWQAYDMVIEGISLLSTKQSEWSTVVRENGIQALIAQLQQEANKKIDPHAKTENKK